MIKEYTCIVCPNGCEIKMQTEGQEIKMIEGNLCDKGKEYVTQEFLAPKRMVTSSVAVLGGELPLASVRTSAPIPKEKIFEAVKEIKGITLTAPVHAGQVVISNLFGSGCDVIVTKTVNA